LPIFASPEIRQDIPHNYIFQRNGERSVLINGNYSGHGSPGIKIPG
jgi:hypothetical protein